MSGDLRPESGGCQATSLDPCYLPSAPPHQRSIIFSSGWTGFRQAAGRTAMRPYSKT